MKKFIFLMLSISLLIFGIAEANEVLPSDLNLGFNTNTTLSVDVIKQEVTDVQSIVSQWKVAFGIINKTGMSFSNLFMLISLFLISLAVIGVILILPIQLAKFFTPDKVDEKLDKIEDFLTKYLIKLPISFIAKIRGITVKKE